MSNKQQKYKNIRLFRKIQNQLLGKKSSKLYALILTKSIERVWRESMKQQLKSLNK